MTNHPHPYANLFSHSRPIRIAPLTGVADAGPSITRTYLHRQRRTQYALPVRAPIRPIRDRWPSILQQKFKRFFWVDPLVVSEQDSSATDFRAAMSAIHVGDTIKITGANRHPNADALIVDTLDTTDMAIVDIGASDGSTSVDLIRVLNGFGSYTIADLYLMITSTRVGRHTLFFDREGGCILIVGRRLVAWPTLSRSVKAIYTPLLRAARQTDTSKHEVLLLNPEARALIKADPRITYREHDVFKSWPGSSPDLIKVANLLRRLYFSDPDIIRALGALHSSLRDGGHLLIVDNGRETGIGPRGGLYQRDTRGFTTAALTDLPPEIHDLVSSYRA